MADNIEDITIGNSGDLVSGTVGVDYTSGQIVSSTLEALDGPTAVAIPAADLALTDTNGVYTVGTTTDVAGVGLSATYSGQAPSTVSTSVTAAGVNVGTSTETAVSTLVCYVSGTLIRTVNGDVAVEHLAVGDLAVTASGEHRPIRWIGHRRTDCRNHPRSHEAMPVRVSAHAFGPDKPARDLWVSPGHSICVDLLGEVLIPAMALVNGTIIQQINVDEVIYWHVELDSHDILLANNLPAESYLDMGNRSFFQENAVTALDASPDADAAMRTHADFCRPFHNDGVIVDAVKTQLRARAIATGWTLDASDPFGGLHLTVDGARVEPIRRGLVARFSLPAEAQDVWLVSTTSSPVEIGMAADTRRLGIQVNGLTIDNGFEMPRRIELADPLLCIGFHALEEGVKRWTTGYARLPKALWEGCEDGFFLRVELVQPALPHWVEPAAVPSSLSAVSDAPRLMLVAGKA